MTSARDFCKHAREVSRRLTEEKRMATIELTAAEAASAFRAARYGLHDILPRFERNRAYADALGSTVGSSVDQDIRNVNSVLRKLAEVADGSIPAWAVPAEETAVLDNPTD